MAHYEFIYILRPDLTTEQIEQVNNRIAEIIATNNGKILETELWGRRQLAYPVKKNAKGYYIFQLLEGGGPLVANLESLLKINEDVLKFQTIAVRKPKFGPTPLAPHEERSSEESETEEKGIVLADEEEDGSDEVGKMNIIMEDDDDE